MRQHPSNSAYTTGCRCVGCRDAHNAYARERRMHQTRRVPAAEYSKRIRQLTQPTMTLAALSQATGVSQWTLRSLRDGNARLNVRTAKKLDPWMGA